MANGAVVRLLPESLPAQPAVPDGCQIAATIGQATADAAVVLAASMLEFHQTGRMTPETKEAGGDKLAALATLELDNLGVIDDFAGIAHREGLRQLRRMLNADPDFRRQVTGAPWRHGGGEVALVIIVDGVLEIVGRVVATEKLFRTN